MMQQLAVYVPCFIAALIVARELRRNRQLARRARSQGENFIDAINPVTGQAFTWCPCCEKAGPAHAFYCGRCGWYLNPNEGVPG